MVTLLAILGVLGVLLAAAFLSTREEPLLADAPRDAADVPLPEGPLSPEDVGRLRFSLAPRGYRMSEVDIALERLARELADRDRRIALLEAAAEGAAPSREVREATPADLPVTPAPAAPAALPEPELAAPALPEPEPLPAAVPEPEPAAPVQPPVTPAAASASVTALPLLTPVVEPVTPDVTVPQEPAPLPAADLGEELQREDQQDVQAGASDGPQSADSAEETGGRPPVQP